MLAFVVWLAGSIDFRMSTSRAQPRRTIPPTPIEISPAPTGRLDSVNAGADGELKPERAETGRNRVAMAACAVVRTWVPYVAHGPRDAQPPKVRLAGTDSLLDGRFCKLCEWAAANPRLTHSAGPGSGPL